jgi:hypothetical protein
MQEFWVLSRHAMDERTVPPDRWASEVERFLSSDAPGETPFAQLAGAVLASIGWLAERSQEPKVDAGTLDDVQAFATLRAVLRCLHGRSSLCSRPAIAADGRAPSERLGGIRGEGA